LQWTRLGPGIDGSRRHLAAGDPVIMVPTRSPTE